VIGASIDAALLVNVDCSTTTAIEDCLTSGMLVPAGERAYAFRHELARQAIYDALSLPRRRELHQRVLTALLGGRWTEQDLARLAHHAEAAGDTDAVLRFAPDAARRAAALYAHREAAAQYARALRFAADWPPLVRADLLEAYSYEWYLTGRLDEAIDLRRDALAIWHASGDPLREGDTLRWISRFTWFAGRNDDAVAAAEAALEVLEAQPPGRELAMALSNRSQLYMLANENEAAIAWGERAIALAEALGEQEILIHALNNVGAARVRSGVEGSWGELERSLALAQAAELEEHVARAWVNLSWSAIHVHDLPRADAYYAAGIAYTTDHDLDGYRQYMLSWRGFLYLLRGEWAAAERDADAVLAVPHTAHTNRIAALIVRGLLRARRGVDGAFEALDAALRLAEPTGELQRLRPVRVARAEAAWLAGDGARATDEASAVLDLTLLRGSPWDVGQVLLWLARCDPAWTGALAGARGVPEPYRHAFDADWAAAAGAWHALGCPYDAALALLDGDEAAVRRALGSFEALGAQAAVAVATRRLRDLGARGVPRGPRPTTRANPANLTVRELEIVPYLAAGQRNAEIAERLFLSPKTVGHHVGSILAKLEIRSRGEVAGAARRLGLDLPDGQDGATVSPT
jgi:DNA-binding CsgD family transcriptional regulator